MLQLLTFILFIFGYTLATAQDYVVTIKGDTLRGEVKYFNNSGSGRGDIKYVRLTSASGEKTNHQLRQTIAFSINNEVYHNVKQGDRYNFLKVISIGYLSLYAFQIENQTTWDGRYLVKKDGQSLDVPNIGFKKRVTQFLSDCPDVVNKVLAGELERTDLVKLVNEYNACIEQKTNEGFAVPSSPVDNEWNTLETKVKALPEFDKKSDALDMIREIKRKVSQNETVPSFLVNGLKESLKEQTSVKEELDQALAKL